MADGGAAGWNRPIGHDFPGFAQEFLRRNPVYRRDYDSVMAAPHRNPIAQEEMAHRWGLCFPGRPAPDRDRRAGLLVAADLSLCRHSRRSAFCTCNTH